MREKETQGGRVRTKFERIVQKNFYSDRGLKMGREGEGRGCKGSRGEGRVCTKVVRGVWGGGGGGGSGGERGEGGKKRDRGSRGSRVR